jgi:hypothetical protein
MRNKIGPSIYYATDKNVYDALQNKRIRVKDIKNYLLDRGIIVSPEDERDALTFYFSSLPFGYHDYINLAQKLENLSKKEKITSSTVNCDATLDVLAEIASSYKEDKKEAGDKCSISKSGDSVVLEVRYTELDFSKTEMTQRSARVARIELSIESGFVLIRRPATAKAVKICNELTKTLAEKKGKNLSQEKISLFAFTEPEPRSYFFEQLSEYISGYRICNVTGVDVHRRRETDEAEDDPDEQEHESDIEDDDSEHDLDEASGLSKSNLASYIEKAALKGESVLSSSEFNQLHSSGFYIYYLVWQVIPQSGVGDKIEFEARFGDPVKCEDFMYSVRGIYNYRSNRHNLSHRPPTSEERQKYISLLEKSARNAYASVIKNYGNSPDED